MNANVFPRSGLIGSSSIAAEAVSSAPKPDTELQGWSSDDFARERIRGLVRRVFFSSMGTPGARVRQIVFSAAEGSTDVGEICIQVGQALAFETSSEIAIVRKSSPEASPLRPGRWQPAATGIKPLSTRLTANLWSVPEAALQELCPEPKIHYWLWALAESRHHFEYVLIEGAAAGAWSGSSYLGQMTDGVILVLEAYATRRVTARKIKQTLEATHSRILGTVLTQRTFPLPETIYRRL